MNKTALAAFTSELIKISTVPSAVKMFRRSLMRSLGSRPVSKLTPEVSARQIKALRPYESLYHGTRTQGALKDVMASGYLKPSPRTVNQAEIPGVYTSTWRPRRGTEFFKGEAGLAIPRKTTDGKFLNRSDQKGDYWDEINKSPRHPRGTPSEDENLSGWVGSRSDPRTGKTFELGDKRNLNPRSGSKDDMLPADEAVLPKWHAKMLRPGHADPAAPFPAAPGPSARRAEWDDVGEDLPGGTFGRRKRPKDTPRATGKGTRRRYDPLKQEPRGVHALALENRNEVRNLPNKTRGARDPNSIGGYYTQRGRRRAIGVDHNVHEYAVRRADRHDQISPNMDDLKQFTPALPASGYRTLPQIRGQATVPGSGGVPELTKQELAYLSNSGMDFSRFLKTRQERMAAGTWLQPSKRPLPGVRTATPKTQPWEQQHLDEGKTLGSGLSDLFQ